METGTRLRQGRQVLRKTQPKATPPPKLCNKPEKPSPILKKVSSFDTVVDVPPPPSPGTTEGEGNGAIDYQSPLRKDGLIMDPPTPLFFSFTYGLYSERNRTGSNGHASHRPHLPDEESSSNCSSCTFEDPSPPPLSSLAVPKKKRVTFAVPEAVAFTMKKVPSAPSLSSLASPNGVGASPRRLGGSKISSSPLTKTLQPSYSFPKKQGPPKAARIAPEVLLDGTSQEDEPGVKKRCSWITAQSDPAYIEYHDSEWGVPVHDDRKLFELLVFSGAQAELSWSAILSKREHYRAVFCGFDPQIVSKFDEEKIASLAADPEILQHEGKLRQIVDNAKCIVEVVQEFGSFDKFVWSFLGGYKPIVNKYRTPQQVPIKSAKSDFMSRDLMKRGFRFVGPTIMYSFMQAAGLTNDHLLHCFRYHCCCSPELNENIET